MESLDSWEGILSEGHLILLIIGVILIAGCLGGTINYLLAREKTERGCAQDWREYRRGIGSCLPRCHIPLHGFKQSRE